MIKSKSPTHPQYQCFPACKRVSSPTALQNQDMHDVITKEFYWQTNCNAYSHPQWMMNHRRKRYVVSYIYIMGAHGSFNQQCSSRTFLCLNLILVPQSYMFLKNLTHPFAI